MSRLYGVARQASEYVRRRLSGQISRADESISQRASSSYTQSRQSLFQRLSDFIFGRTDKRYPPTAPPGRDSATHPPVEPTGGRAGGANIPPPPPIGPRSIVPPPPPNVPPPYPTQPNRLPPGSDGGNRDGSGGGYIPPGDDGELGAGDFRLLGRDASYDPADWQVVMDSLRLTPGSSNVYGYYFEFESRTRGILYVTFLGQNSDGTRSGAGATYGYYDVPGQTYHQFQNAAASSAGGAVWDYLRVRGTQWAHQHNYRLIQVSGDYIPRKATQRGYRTRNLPTLNTNREPAVNARGREIGRLEYRRSTLPERIRPIDGRPNRGRPDRGEPDRG